MESEHIRRKILLDHLEDLARRTDDQNLRHALTVISCKNLMGTPQAADRLKNNADGPGEYILRTLPGGLTEDDIHRYAASSTKLDGSVQSQLTKDLEHTLTEITAFYLSDEALSKEELLEQAQSLPDDLLSHLDRLHQDKAELSARQDKVISLIEELHKIHPRLHEKLSTFLSRFSTPTHNKQLLTHDILASKIETSLLKLSLIRAKAHTTLYGFRSPKNPEATMEKALTAAHGRYAAEERRLEEENRQLDRQLEEYRQLLELVDGRSKDGGFAQVVEDWVRVQKETEECKRDLRRLGWTGD